MAGFLYYIPGAGGALEAERAKELGLGYALQKPITSREVGNGPDGRSGVVAVDGTTFGKDEKYPVSYLPKRQKWLQIPGSEVWVGVYCHSLPAPEDLEVEGMLDGYLLPMANGQTFQIPMVQVPADTAPGEVWDNALPCGVALDEEGRPVPGEVQEEHKTLQTIAARHLSVWMGEATALDDASAIEAAVIVLATNYRIRMAEAVLLGLFVFGGPQAGQVLGCTIGVPRIYDLKKKADAAGASSNDGVPADAPTTGQV